MQPFYSRYYTFIKPILRNRFVRDYSAVAFSLGLTAIFIIFAIEPTVVTIVTLQKDISSQKQILSQLRQKSDNLTQAKQSYNNLDPNLKTSFESLIPNQPDVPGLVNAVDVIALQNQASISGIQLQPVELTINPSSSKTGVLESLPFSFSTISSFAQVENILTGINNSGRLISIDSINLTKREAGGIVLTINGKGYVLR